MALTKASRILWLAGAVSAASGWLLFIRMAIELNRVLPPRDKIPMLEIRYHFFDVKRLHEERFPKSSVRLASFTLIGLSTGLLAGAIFAEISR